MSGRAALSATDLPGEPPAKDDMDKLADSVSAQQLQAAIDPVLKPVIDAIIAEGRRPPCSVLPRSIVRWTTVS